MRTEILKLKYGVIHPQVLEAIDNTITNKNTKHKVIELIKDMQIVSRGQYKPKTKLSKKYVKFGNWANVLNLHNLVLLAENNPNVFLVTSIKEYSNQPSRLYLSVYNDTDNNGNPLEADHLKDTKNNNKSYLKMRTQDDHQLRHKKEFLKEWQKNHSF